MEEVDRVMELEELEEGEEVKLEVCIFLETTSLGLHQTFLADNQQSVWKEVISDF